ncbi:flagellar hook-basal body complex protein [Neomoorella thermoacetica]|uniref:flagellar hook-basal body complex protein n=1 Tax=Neomoorella thermoacetica TaxID=1525 RepID=UPI0008FB99BE|nr:flagellar hook-basal body complex protein [Moorella thermoacetica]APC07899.1 flagellar basal-body rod protein FlgG [Moorella thermoacetica]
MMRSLYSGVSGLRTHQTRMDVIGDNIANVNTVGFKRSAVTFKDVFYQTLRGGSAGDSGGTGMGGTNPQQIGLGVTLGSIDVVHTQGAAASTGNGTDLMIQGDGFFRVTPDDGTTIYYTRAGAFHFDSQGFLVNVDGMKVLDSAGSPVQIPGMNDPSTMPQSFSIDKLGVVHYVDNSGQAQTLSNPISVAKFSNPAGLEKIGQSLYRETASSGAPGTDLSPGTGSLANTTIIPSTLEMSNVDLAQEFTDMIITERGFQANARTITTSDQLLQELVNLKR